MTLSGTLSPEPGDRQWTKPRVRALIQRLESAATAAANLLGAPRRLRSRATDLVAAVLDRQVDARLGELPIAELRDHLKPRTKLSLVEKDGFGSVAAILDASPQRLAAISGVGEQTAAHVWETAQQVRAGVAADMGFRFDPSRPDAAQTVLLAHLTAMRSADAAVKKLGPGLRELVETASVLAPRAAPVASTFRRFLARKRTKAAGFAAVSEMDRFLAASGELVEQLDRARAPADPGSYDHTELWKSFHADAASYYSLLSGLARESTQDETAAARGHFDAEFAETIATVELDTRLVSAALRGYQHFGAQFALQRGRAILGDEMGLGKTVQALAACAHLAASGRSHFLVVCPASVLLNWLAEIEKHTLLAAYRLHGDERDRQENGRRWLRDGGVAVTTFDTLPRLRFLDGRSLAMLVVDEAHYIKNRDTRRARATLPFIDRSEHTLLLSGTPLENRITDFRNLVSYLRPSLAERVRQPSGPIGVKAFRRKVAEVYLRRNQTDVLRELPERIEVEEWVLFTKEDLRVYRHALSGELELGLLEKLRQAAYRSADSAKLKRVLELIQEATADGLKVVVFSRYLDVLARIEAELSWAKSWTLNGSVPVAARQPLIDAFTGQEGPAVLLAQIDTGGTGINLQSASAVIITEPQWKPTTEDQAVARLHRMGQVRNVQVHRILAKGTVDELLRQTQDRKRQLFDEFARKSDAKDADHRAIDTSTLPAALADETMPLEMRIVLAEHERHPQR